MLGFIILLGAFAIVWWGAAKAYIWTMMILAAAVMWLLNFAWRTFLLALKLTWLIATALSCFTFGLVRGVVREAMSTTIEQDIAAVVVKTTAQQRSARHV